MTAKRRLEAVAALEAVAVAATGGYPPRLSTAPADPTVSFSPQNLLMKRGVNYRSARIQVIYHTAVLYEDPSRPTSAAIARARAVNALRLASG